MKKSIYNVNGMTCATCALTVEKAVGKVAGVSKATVNFATEKVTVEYDEQEVGMKDLQMAVEKAGYEKQALVPFLKMKQVHKFYLTYNMRFTEFDPRWNLFYPRGF